ncbi:oxidoreductase [Aureimonas endophytica]|uniref:Oxidoreductase n=1 Tax=Aureimonas endophytica TaxID=2027858 RepID=A0A916ZNA5_9HYPH|nr:FAD-dependent oxidoreductase [Aureimonas endophytica]GGE05951.1 oxidoreductase [Aureimonas endophytica]
MFAIDWKTPHLWRRTNGERRAVAPALAGDVEADVAIVGGGFTGLSPALTLVEAGVSVVLLEGNEIGSAASGRNNGLVIPHHSKATPAEMAEAVGPVHGERYNALVAGAARQAFALMEKHAIAAHGVQRGWMQPAHTEEALARARRFHDEWRAFGCDVEWLDGDAMSAALGTPYRGGWRAREGGHVNPFALVQGLARAAEAAGVRLFENSKVTALVREGERWRLRSGAGSVLARKVLLATNALTGRIWPKLGEAVIPLQVYQVATKPLSHNLRAAILKDDPAVSDMRRDMRYFHYDADGRLVTGGTLATWRDARRRGLAQSSAMVGRVFPQLGEAPELEDYWEGVFGLVPDRKPRLMRLAPGLVFAGIYSGRGVALSLALGREVGAWLAEQRRDADMPLPVTDLRRVPGHALAVEVARRIHPLHKLRDRLDGV